VSEGELNVFPDADELYRAAAGQFVQRARAAVTAHSRFTVALSGGSTPKSLYTLLGTDAALRDAVPWAEVHVFWGDERHVPPEHQDSNYRMAAETLLSKVPVAPGNVHRISGENPDAAQAALDYELTLRKVFQIPAPLIPRFDLILLGLGSDAHTASLFPHSPALNDRQRLVVANWVAGTGTSRITLTATAINHAACVIFLVSGGDKADPLNAVLNGPYDPAALPAQAIHPLNGTLLWLADAAASRSLQHSTR
jgi:6-phosphogluconolactonase